MENVRIYNGSDAYLLEQSAVLRTLYNSEIAIFTAFDTKLDAAYSAQWQQAEDAALHFIDDVTVVGEMVQKTETVINIARMGGLMWREVKYFADKAFDSRESILQQFGLGSYDKARRTQAGLVAFLDELYHVSSTYQNELVAAGMPSGRIMAIDQLRLSLQEASTQHETFVRNRSVLASQRIQKMNTCYQYLARVIEAAQIIFNDNPERRGRYVYFPTEESANERIINGELNPAEFRNIDFQYQPDTIVSMQNTGVSPLEFFLSNDGVNPIGNIIPIGGGMIVTQQLSQLGTSGQHLTVRNTGAVNGSFEVAIRE